MMIRSIVDDRTLKDLVRLLRGQACGATHVSGLWGSSAPMVAAHLASTTKRPILYLAAHPEEADNIRDDIELFLGRGCDLLPAWETVPGEGVASGEILAERVQVCSRFAELFAKRTARKNSAQSALVVAPIQAVMQPVPTQQTLRTHTVKLAVGKCPRKDFVRSPDDLLRWAVERGYERLGLVEAPGDVAKRGDIVDLFVPGDSRPCRFEFFDDEIESIRRFDISTQRSLEKLDQLTITAVPVDLLGQKEASTDFLSYLPKNSLIVLHDPVALQEMGQALQTRLSQGAMLMPVADVLVSAAGFDHLHLTRFGSETISSEKEFRFNVTSLARFEGDAAESIAELCRLSDDHEVIVFCDNDGERVRLREMLVDQSPESAERIRLEIGVMHGGFDWSSTSTIVVSHHELFRRHRPRRRVRKMHASRPLDSWLDLKPGDHVVHIAHGIARFRGLERISKTKPGQEEEYLSLEFADHAVVHVPVSQIDLVQQYIGSAGRKPILSKLGGRRWAKTKEQVAESVTEMAESLLRVQALRAQGVGTAYPKDTNWQREFEAAFLYEETEDQLIVAKDIREDLIKPRPMDRLICGDVGYGKTELAMRAAFKVVEYGRQVAVLVPTTVLAEQHYATFSERMADYPFTIARLSRFRSTKEQKQTVEQAKRGQVDIVIGTHRLLSADVKFANLGLVIIDEEQRFGVEHKERLKSMRETVEVLTLTATPIPRTLHMSLMGIRDISSLQTPPVDRRSIATQVRPFDRGLIREAIVREMNRDGQVYFVHNYVQSIASIADTIRSIVPEARVVFGHGQMKDGELEKVMHGFVNREADVLVATTIIESGIDIPSVNTIFINRAERHGLANLHQLRGRVGRSDHKAYCYLLLSPNRPPTGKAAKRLKTIEEFSELGAGFRIAMRDLEIRGAGNLLGAQQSGHIAAVGYELYCRMLDQAVRRLRNEPAIKEIGVHVDLDISAYIPAHYMHEGRARIETYRRLASCTVLGDLTQLERDLADVFGPIPLQLQRLIEIAEIRVRADTFGVKSITLKEPDVVFVVDQLARVEPVFAGSAGTVRMPDPNTVHLRLPPNYMETGTLLAVLRKMLSCQEQTVGAN